MPAYFYADTRTEQVFYCVVLHTLLKNTFQLVGVRMALSLDNNANAKTIFMWTMRLLYIPSFYARVMTVSSDSIIQTLVQEG